MQPVKNVLQEASEVDTVLSEQAIGRHAEFAQIHNVYISVVLAGPHANLL